MRRDQRSVGSLEDEHERSRSARRRRPAPGDRYRGHGAHNKHSAPCGRSVGVSMRSVRQSRAACTAWAARTEGRARGAPASRALNSTDRRVISAVRAAHRHSGTELSRGHSIAPELATDARRGATRVRANHLRRRSVDAFLTPRYTNGDDRQMDGNGTITHRQSDRATCAAARAAPWA